MVNVISMNGHKLAPTHRHGKVRHLLREGRAVAVMESPFTIQLLYSEIKNREKIHETKSQANA